MYKSFIYLLFFISSLTIQAQITVIDTTILDEVVISASKFEEKQSDVPQQIQVITKKNIQFTNSQTTADLLQATGNVFVQKSQMGGGSPVIRGFEANKVLLVVDGVRLNNAIYRGGHLQNILSLDNNTLDRAEIIQGPSSVVYGSDALGGVMHFITKNPELADSSHKTKIKGGGLTRYSSANNEKTIHADLNVGFKKIAFLTNFTFSDFDDLRQGANRNSSYSNFGKNLYYAARINNKDSMVSNSNYNIQKRTEYSQYDFMQKALFKPNAFQTHVLNFQYSTTSNVSRYDRLSEIDAKTGILKNAEWYYGPQKRLMAAYSVQLTKSRRLFDHAKWVTAFQDIDESRHNRSFGKTSLNHRMENVKVYSINLDFAKEIKSDEFRYGIEFIKNWVESTANVENINTGEKKALDTRYPGKGSTMQSLALYLTHTHEFSKKLILTEGIRFSNVRLNATFDTTFFKFPFTTIHQNSNALNGILGSTGFRAPNVDDLSKVFESSAGKVIVPNDQIKPEYTYNSEFCISKFISKRIKVEASGYYTWYRDILVVTKARFNGSDSIMYDGKLSAVMQQENRNKAYIYGFNAGFSGELTKNISLINTINYTYGRVKLPDSEMPLDHIAPTFGKSSILVKYHKLRAEFFVIYNGWKRLKNYSNSGEDNLQYATANGMPSWYTLNVRSSYQIHKYLLAQLSVENILDRNYRTFASGVSAPGRNLVLSLRANF
jgi:hemoglobin/transferrin/lactoferrin receptor protein